MSLQCAPCLSDLALVREAVTSVGGTSTCTAHAVLLRHPGDDPGRRRRRLSDLRTLAESRVVDATGAEKERLELLVQEYAVADAMDLGAPDRTGPGRAHERGRRGKERRPGEPREQREPREPREPRPDRPDRGRGPRAGGQAPTPEGTTGPEGTPNEAEVVAPVIESVIATEGGPGEAAPQPSAAPEPVAQPAAERSTSQTSSPDTSAPAAPSPEPAAPSAAPEPAATPAPARDDSAFSTPDPDAS